MHGNLLSSETNHQLDADAQDEAHRQDLSFALRVRTNANYQDKTRAIPPTTSELTGIKCFVDDSIHLPDAIGWLASLYNDQHGKKVDNVWEATVFISKNPRAPANKLVTFAAILQGAWVITPEVLLGNGSAACVKYLPALNTKRFIWASPKFRTTHPMEWRVLLEILNLNKTSKWHMLSSPQRWAAEKVKADATKVPSTDCIGCSLRALANHQACL